MLATAEINTGTLKADTDKNDITRSVGIHFSWHKDFLSFPHVLNMENVRMKQHIVLVSLYHLFPVKNSTMESLTPFSLSQQVKKNILVKLASDNDIT